MYRNEKGVGEASPASGLDRSEIYITSKLNNGFHRPDDARRAFDGTLEALGSVYVDLFLIHWPLPTLYDGDFVSTWRTLEYSLTTVEPARIGVSNFQVAHLQRLVQECDVVPTVNQIEVHPYLCNEEVRAAEHRAWNPHRGMVAAGEGKCASRSHSCCDCRSDWPDPRPGRASWHVQRGDIVFPKSTTPARIEENFQIFDFELEPEDIAAISALDRGEEGRTGPNPDVFAYVPR